jgi:hypothetical protein
MPSKRDMDAFFARFGSGASPSPANSQTTSLGSDRASFVSLSSVLVYRCRGLGGFAPPAVAWLPANAGIVAGESLFVFVCFFFPPAGL